MNEKSEIRKIMKEKLSSLSKPLYEHFSYLIAQRLFQDSDWKEAEMIGITVSNPPEVDTFQIIRKAWDEGKRVAIPKCCPDTKTMEFRTLTAFNQLESVYYGLFEPIKGLTEKVEPSQIQLLIVPGLAFTKNGYRVGFGGGYYDRYLQHYNGKTLSLAFQMQLMDTLPFEKHDLPVGKIITEKGTLSID